MKPYKILTVVLACLLTSIANATPTAKWVIEFNKLPTLLTKVDSPPRAPITITTEQRQYLIKREALSKDSSSSHRPRANPSRIFDSSTTCCKLAPVLAASYRQ